MRLTFVHIYFILCFNFNFKLVFFFSITLKEVGFHRIFGNHDKNAVCQLFFYFLIPNQCWIRANRMKCLSIWEMYLMQKDGIALEMIEWHNGNWFVCGSRNVFMFSLLINSFQLLCGIQMRIQIEKKCWIKRLSRPVEQRIVGTHPRCASPDRMRKEAFPTCCCTFVLVRGAKNKQQKCKSVKFNHLIIEKLGTNQ